jgi:hypothetical protein
MATKRLEPSGRGDSIWTVSASDEGLVNERRSMTSKNAGKRILSVRTLGAVLAAVFAVLAAACAPTNTSPGPAPSAPPPSKGAPAPGVAVPAPVQSNI